MKLRVASQSTVIFAARIMGAGVIFLTQAVMARLWGGAELGNYLIVMATVNLIAVAMPLGFHTVGTYFAAEYRARGQGGLLRRFVLRSYIHVFAVAAAVLLIGLPVSYMLPANLAVLAGLWLPTSLMALSTALVFVSSDILIGLKRPFAGFFAEGLIRPLLVASAFGIAYALAQANGLVIMIWTLSVAYFLVAVGHFFVLIGSLRSVPDDGERAMGEGRRWWRYAAPWILIALATDFFFDLDLIVLANLLDTRTLAVFGICARIFALAAFGITAIYAVSLPEMFESEARSEREEFHRKVGDANMLAAGLALAMFLGVTVFGRFAMMLFGPEFESGSGILTVLFLVLLVRAVFGPTSLILSIHGRPYASLPAVALGLVGLVGFNLLLVPHFGAMGAAYAALGAISLWSASLWLTTYRLTGLDVSIVSGLRLMRRGRARPSSAPGA